jgi:rhodanese-related sulfurtransferase
MSDTPDWMITPSELKECIDSVVLVDVREPEEFEECRIEGCKLIPLGELQARAPQELKPEDDIVVYCAHGVRSVQGVMALRMLGFERTRSLDGGIAAWLELP